MKNLLLIVAVALLGACANYTPKSTAAAESTCSEAKSECAASCEDKAAMAQCCKDAAALGKDCPACKK